MNDFNLIHTIFSAMNIGIDVNESNLHIFTSGLVAIVLIIASFHVYNKAKKTGKMISPPARIGIYNTFELTTQTILGLLRDILGDKAERYLSLIGSLFIYIFVCNLLSVVPGFVAPTNNLNTTLACSLVVFVFYNYVGIKELGIKKYIKQMAGPVAWLAPFIVIIELISHIVRPISMGVRLYGNMMGDHLVLVMFSDLVPFLVPILFMLLAIFVSFIQAFVFSLLSTVYIALATSDEG